MDLTEGELAIVTAQLAQLFKPINGQRVADLRGMSYLEAWDVISHLGRIFGPLHWDKEVPREALIFEEAVTWTKDGQSKSGWDVAYRAVVRLTVRTYIGVKISEDVATGSATHQPSRADAHDLALKSAVSDALKRAAKDLGNQFGLSLYDKASLRSVLGYSIAHPDLEQKRTQDTGPSPEEPRTEEINGEQIPLAPEMETTRSGPPSDLPTPKQLRFAKDLLAGYGLVDEESLMKWFSLNDLGNWPGAVNNISKVQASAIIEKLGKK